MLSNLFGEKVNVGVRAARAVAALGEAYDHLKDIGEAIGEANEEELIWCNEAARLTAKALTHGAALLNSLMQEELEKYHLDDEIDDAFDTGLVPN